MDHFSLVKPFLHNLLQYLKENKEKEQLKNSAHKDTCKYEIMSISMTSKEHMVLNFKLGICQE